MSERSETNYSRKRTRLAEDRTDWAEDRTLLANERTFAAWIRTALASGAVGLGFQAVVSAFEPTWMAKAGATIFLVIAIFMLIASGIDAARIVRRLSSTKAEAMSALRIGFITLSLSIASAGIIAMIWMIEDPTPGMKRPPLRGAGISFAVG